MTSTTTGKEAETAVASVLRRQKYEIIAQNWRTPTYEIDLIAKKDKTILFIEVKFRRSAEQGDGLDYITPAKIKQMTFAGQSWCAENKWDGDWRLVAVAVKSNGSKYEVGELTEVN